MIKHHLSKVKISMETRIRDLINMVQTLKKDYKIEAIIGITTIRGSKVKIMGQVTAMVNLKTSTIIVHTINKVGIKLTNSYLNNISQKAEGIRI